MRLQKVDTKNGHGGWQGQCCQCKNWVGCVDLFWDCDGPPFRSYYCSSCAWNNPRPMPPISSDPLAVVDAEPVPVPKSPALPMGKPVVDALTLPPIDTF